MAGTETIKTLDEIKTDLQARYKKEGVLTEAEITAAVSHLAMVPVRSRASLDSIHPDFDKVAAVSRRYETIGYHLFTRDALRPQDTAYCRNLAPLYGIPEEAATGTSSGALACYLMHHEGNR